MKTRLIAAMSIVLASPAFAHPGHGEHGGGFSLFHYLAEPVHAVGVALVVAFVGGFLYFRFSRRSARR